MTKLSDFVAQFLVDHGIERVFMVTGGGAMHLNDSLGNRPGLKAVFNHHEQACAIAAEGAARLSGKVEAVLVTTGPGGLNTLTGVMGQWTDSVPVIYLSGQVKWETMLESCRELPLRQLGDQEVDIIPVVRPLTKFAVTVKDPRDIRAVLEEALHHAVSGRPGPVWVNVPMNVQGANIDVATLRGFVPPARASVDLTPQAAQVRDLLAAAERPVLVAGRGVRISGAQGALVSLAEHLGVPVLTTLNGFDLIPSEHPLYVGRIGSQGTRAGNFALQNSDLVITIGTRNNVRQLSYNWACFARAAKKVVVDIDEVELKKPTLVPDVPVCADAGAFLAALSKAEHERPVGRSWGSWVSWCIERREKYPAALPEYAKSEKGVHPYHFAAVLSRHLREGEVIVTANGTANVAYFQAGVVKKGQVAIWNSGCAAMGYDLPAAIGASVAGGKREVICLAGDGSLQMNVQELATVAYHRLPIKIFLFDNGGYASIRQTQRNFFGRFVGCDLDSGLGCPDLAKVAEAYGVPSVRIDETGDLDARIVECLSRPGPLFVNVVMAREYVFSPKVASARLPDGRMVSRPLEDMAPFLDREELKSNLLIPPWPET